MMSGNPCKQKQHELSEATASALYIHVPFCKSKCRYCDFFSVLWQAGPAERYARAAAAELERRRADLPAPVSSIFLGGGTPTVLGEGLRPILAAAGEFAGGGTEFSVEANPGTITPAVAEMLVDGGVNRLTMGAQSFHERDLEALGRHHRPEQVDEAVALVRAAGITNVGLDLMYGIPGQTSASWRESLRRAIDLGVNHLSCYALSFEPGTPMEADLREGRVCEMDEAEQADCYQAAISILTASGMDHYEISNFALPGRQCLHNITYWENKPYVGIGPGAASYVGGVRRTNHRDLSAYLDSIESGRPAPSDSEHLEGRAVMAETAILNLRMTQGLSRKDFMNRFGEDFLSAFPKSVHRYDDAGALKVTEDFIRISPSFLFVADTILAEIVAEA